MADYKQLRDALEQAEPEVPSAQKIEQLWKACNNPGVFARAVLARWGRPAPQSVPVAVSDRLPGPEDCLDEGWAWFFNPRTGWRQATQPVHTVYTHWLPANALPLPSSRSN